MSAAENISLYKLPDLAEYFEGYVIANLSKPAQVWNVIFLAEGVVAVGEVGGVVVVSVEGL
jgi:hypothetical protein